MLDHVQYSRIADGPWITKSAALLALGLTLSFQPQLYAFDPAVEVADQADRAARQLELEWVAKKQTWTDLIEQQRHLQDVVAKELPDRSINPEALCSDQFLSPEGTVVLARLRDLDREFETAVREEINSNESWRTKLSEATSAQAAYDTRLAYYQKVVWSQARLRMLKSVSDVYLKEAEFHRLMVRNTCAMSRVIEANPAQRSDVKTLTALKASLDAGIKRSSTSLYGPYHNTLLTITSMP